MRRVFPYPVLMLLLLAMWLLLAQSVSVGNIVLGTFIAFLAASAMAALQPAGPKVKRPGAILRLAAFVAADIVRSNLAVALVVLSRDRHTGTSGFMTVHLDLRDHHGLAVLACIVTATPGTMWLNFDLARGTLLIHVLDLVDEATWVNLIKNRYERLLLEIFE